MGRIRRLFLLARYQGTPTEHVVHLRRGRTVHCGVGLAFWFRPALAAISEVPATDHERPVLFHVATRDQQDVTVQAVLTYRFADPETAARRLDLAVHPVTDDAERVQGVRQVADLVGEVAQSLVVDVLRALDLPEALSTGLPLVRDALVDGMRGQERLAGVGVEVCDVRVLSLRPEADIEKALQTPLREQLQTEADRALYERRACRTSLASFFCAMVESRLLRRFSRTLSLRFSIGAKTWDPLRPEVSKILLTRSEERV